MGTLIISILALSASIISLWYNFFKKTKPIFNVYNWTAMGKVWDLEIDNKGLALLINLKIINNGIKPIILKDLVMVVTTANKEKNIYIPTFLWDMKTYIQQTGTPVSIIDTQKGLVPLPMVVPSKGIFDYPYEIMFTPRTISIPLNTITDAPFEISLFVLSSHSDNYIEVAKHVFEESEITPIIKGNYVISPSVEIKERRNSDPLFKI
ncbi:hypothetical protein [Myroides odoratimimus]|uniref:hypothetical protein n=1 Tax=Myroides odoratimimus TaxID=76832 RepID=UPI003100CC93